MTVAFLNNRETASCRCCDGGGEVESAEGEMRPCSRCRWVDFRAWCRARAPQAAPAPAAGFSLDPAAPEGMR